MNDKPKTIEEVKKIVDDTYLLRMFENEYSTLRDTEIQLEYLETKEGQNMYGKEIIEQKKPVIQLELERLKGRVHFIKKKILEKRLKEVEGLKKAGK